MANASVATRKSPARGNGAIVVEQPMLVETLRGFREVESEDARRVADAIRCLKTGSLSAAQLNQAVAAGTFREVIDRAAAGLN